MFSEVFTNNIFEYSFVLLISNQSLHYHFTYKLLELDQIQRDAKILLFLSTDSGSNYKIVTAEVLLLVPDTNDNDLEFEHSPNTVHDVEEMILDNPI